MRPYVLGFFIIYFIGCLAQFGLLRTVAFTVLGYFIAWVSEFLSINIGIPYGYYYYIEKTRPIELWLMGVPVWDSISYVFLVYASYSTALLVVCPLVFPYLLETRRLRHGIYTRVLATVLFVYLDIIIDPITLHGDKWFLGQVYGYNEKGAYFGVPISNFIGWFVTGFLMITVFQKVDSFLFNKNIKDKYANNWSLRYTIGPALYVSVMIFNLGVAFYIRQYNIAIAGFFIAFMIIVFLYTVVKYNNKDVKDIMKAHKEDFPDVVIL